MEIQALIWDLGGVLVRTEDYKPRQEFAEKIGLTPFELETLVFSSPSGIRAQLGEIKAEQHWQNISRQLELTEVEIAQFQKVFWAGDHLDTTLVHTIRDLRIHYKTALLSNAFSDLREMVTYKWKIEDAFDQIIISSEIGIMKPDLGVFNLALNSLGVNAKQAVFIDDFLQNIQGARGLNINTIHFQSTDQTLTELGEILRMNLHERK